MPRGRKPLGDRAMTGAERQARYAAKHAASGAVAARIAALERALADARQQAQTPKPRTAKPLTERQQARAEAEYEARLQRDLQVALDETVLPAYHKELERLRDEVNYLRKGSMTRAQYKKIWTCLHPDRVQEPKLVALYTECFQLWAKLEFVLISEAEAPLPPTAVPRTYAEMMAARAKASAQRSRPKPSRPAPR